MTDTTYGAQHPPANWGFYLLINIVVGIAVGVLEWALQTYANFGLPSFLVNIATLVLVTWIAGRAWLSKAGGVWDRQDRHRLAFAYVMVNLVMSVIFLAIIFALMSTPFAQEAMASMGLTPEMLAVGGAMMAVFLIVLIPLVLWASYGIMRLVLAHMVGAGATERTPVDTFN